MSTLDSWAIRQLQRLAETLIRFPRWFLYPQILIFLVCVIYTFLNLEFLTDRNELVGSDKKYHRIFLEFREEFPNRDDIVAVIESDDPKKNRQFAERLGRRLGQETQLFTHVLFQQTPKILGSKSLYLLPPETLDNLRKTLDEYRPFIDNIAGATNLVSFFSSINRQFRNTSRENPEDGNDLIGVLPSLQQIIGQAQAAIERSGIPPSPGVAALLGGDEEAQQQAYITFDSGRIFLVTAQALSAKTESGAVKKFRELIEQTRSEVSGVNAGITGEPVIENDEMVQSQKDTLRASLIALVLVAVIFIFGYHEMGRPIKATLSLVVGLGYTMGYTTLVVGHLNILTITFAPILIGLAIDSGVHLVARFEEELSMGNDPERSVSTAIVYTGRGILTGSLTTAGAFMVMAFTEFKGIQEMGVITGGGMIVCLIPMMTLLPIMLLRGEQRPKKAIPFKSSSLGKRLDRLCVTRPAIILTVGLGMCGLSLTQFEKVHFDYNLLNMQSTGLPAVVFEEKLIESASKSVLFGAITADDIPEAKNLLAQLNTLSTVASVDSLIEILPENPEQISEEEELKTRQINQIKNALRDLNFEPIDESPVSTAALSQVLYSLQGYFGQAVSEVRRQGDQPLLDQLTEMKEAVIQLRKTINGNPEIAAIQLTRFRNALLVDVRETLLHLKNQDTSFPLRGEDLPSFLRSRFIGITGKVLLQVYPKQNIWERDHQEQFVNDLRHVDPESTGTPFQFFEYTTLLKVSYQIAAGYAALAMIVLVWLRFRSWQAVIASFLPVAAASIWLLGIMGLFGIPFNPANIMTLPLVIGIGVTNGIHILNRFTEENSPEILSTSTGKAVIVSGLTTVSGFGSLTLAEHQGIASLGYVMSIGVTLCMIAALTCLPSILTLFQKSRNKTD